MFNSELLNYQRVTIKNGGNEAWHMDLASDSSCQCEVQSWVLI